MLEAAIVAVFAFLVFVGIEGWIGMPTSRSHRIRVMSNRRSFRFGLRDLLLAVTLVAVLLGIFAAAN